MKTIMKVTALAAIAMATPAVGATLTTGTGDGQVTLDVGATGQISGGGLYNPVGSQVAASTVYLSDVYLRVGNSGVRTSLAAGTVGSFTGDDTQRTSIFTLGDLSIALTQSVSNLLENGVQSGSLLTQSYAITNNGASDVSLDLVRYFDGDLNFDGSLSDGGGLLMSGGAPLLFEIDSATGASTATTFVGAYNRGGTANGYQIDYYSNLKGRIETGGALLNTIDRDTNGDGFVDTGYDLALGLGNQLQVGAGRTGTFSTFTLFGSGTPGSVVAAVPEPSTWAMMLAGFAMTGAAMRRRRSAARQVLA